MKIKAKDLTLFFLFFAFSWSFHTFKSKDALPVILHIHNNPALGIRLVEGRVQRADMAFAVIGKLASPIGSCSRRFRSPKISATGKIYSA
jgi:hypothetical protein